MLVTVLCLYGYGKIDVAVRRRRSRNNHAMHDFRYPASFWEWVPRFLHWMQKERCLHLFLNIGLNYGWGYGEAVWLYPLSHLLSRGEEIRFRTAVGVYISPNVSTLKWDTLVRISLYDVWCLGQHLCPQCMLCERYEQAYETAVAPGALVTMPSSTAPVHLARRVGEELHCRCSNREQALEDRIFDCCIAASGEGDYRHMKAVFPITCEQGRAEDDPQEWTSPPPEKKQRRS